MKVKEIRLKKIIKTNYQAHLVEAIIRQLITEGKMARVTIEEMENYNVSKKKTENEQ